MSHYALIINNTSAVPDSAIQNIAVAFVSVAGGVVGASDYQVTALTGNGSVQIATGRGYVPFPVGGPVTNMYPTLNDANISQLITANASGNSRIDSIVLYVTVPAPLTTNGLGVAKIADVNGTPAASPVPPTNAQILAAIGAGNPYVILANVTVPNGFGGTSTISTISDQRTFCSFNTGQTVPVLQYEEFTDQGSPPSSPASGKTRVYTKGAALFAKNPSGGIAQVGSNTVVPGGITGASVAVDWSQGIVQAFTMGTGVSGGTTQSSITFSAFNNPVAGEKLILILTQGAGGSNGTTLVLPGTVKWPNGAAPVLSTAAGKVDILGFLWDGTSFYGISSLTY